MTGDWASWPPIVGGFITVGAVLYRFGQRVGRLTLQVDTMWAFLLRRAKAELLSVGWAEKRSPLNITISTFAEFNRIIPFLPQVLATYQRLMAQKPPPTEQDLFITFEREFGEQLVDALCVPYKVSLGACVIALIEACRFHSTQQPP